MQVVLTLVVGLRARHGVRRRRHGLLLSRLFSLAHARHRLLLRVTSRLRKKDTIGERKTRYNKLTKLENNGIRKKQTLEHLVIGCNGELYEVPVIFHAEHVMICC